MCKRTSFIFKILSVFLICVFTTASGFAQKERKNIYVFDCTNSMEKKSLWQPALDALDASIGVQSSIPGSEFTIIPLGDQSFKTYSFSAGQYGKYEKEIKNTFSDAMKLSRNTHISPALSKAFQDCDPDKENRIYLLTDGEPNHSDSPEKVASLISKWCANHKSTRLFYVALCNEAVNPIIEKAINDCQDAFIVKCTSNVIPQVEDLNNVNIYANINELNQSYGLTFSSPGTYSAAVTCHDPIFNVELIGGKIKNSKLELRISPRNGETVEELHNLLKDKTDQTDNYLFPIRIQATDSRTVIVNPDVLVHVADYIQSKLILAEESNELVGSNGYWHDSFLWSSASESGVSEFDLTPVFSNPKSNSEIQMKLVPSNNQKDDYTAYLNDKAIENGESFTITPGQPAKIRIVFNPDAQEGKRYFSLQKTDSDDLDIINSLPEEEFDSLSLRSKYSIKWNPLKTVFFWIGIILLALLILWFLFLKRIFFPIIKIKRIVFTGPGSYYLSKKIKGARKVVFSSKKRTQNILSRLFTGEIIYVTAPHFIPDIELEPTTRKKVRLKSMSKNMDGWDFIPASSLGSYEKSSATRRNTKEKFNIEVQ